MSTDSKGTNGAPDTTADGGVADEAQTQSETVNAKDKDVVAYETYKKTLSLAKKREAELEAERAEKQKLLEEKLAVEGKKDELIESWKKKYEALEGKTKKAVGSFSYKVLASAISTEAVKEGCINVGDLIQLSDLSTVEMDDEFNVDTEQIREMVLRSKKERPYLFSNSKAGPNTGIPSNGAKKVESDEWKKLSPKDMAKIALQKMMENKK